MLVDSKKMKVLRQKRNWTQQHLAEVCDLSIRTIQRVEKDGVASNETVAAYSAVFELEASELLIAVEQFEKRDRTVRLSPKEAAVAGLLFFGGVVSGIGISVWLF